MGTRLCKHLLYMWHCGLHVTYMIVDAWVFVLEQSQPNTPEHVTYTKMLSYSVTSFEC